MEALSVDIERKVRALVDNEFKEMQLEDLARMMK